MAPLDDLSRKLRAGLPEFLDGQPPTQRNASSRLSRDPMYILPEDQYKSARTRLGGFGDRADAFTDQNPNFSLQSLADPFRSPSLRGILQSAKSGIPTMTFNRDNPNSMDAMGHEVAHAIAG